jgi:hypothetical protein
MRILLIFFLLLVSIISHACDCVQQPLVTKIQHSDFIAKIKVLSVSKPTVDGEYQTAQIEVLNLFKGVKTQIINIHSALQSSCMLVVEKNTEWLVFANYGHTGVLEFGSCSGSTQLEKMMNAEAYPNLEEKLKKSMALKIAVLNYFKKSKIENPNRNNFNLSFREFQTDEFKGFDVKGDRFAIYQLKIEKDLSISKIEALKEFDNKELSKKIEENLKKQTKVKSTQVAGIDEPSYLTVVLYYYPSEANSKSFISIYDL